MAFVIEKDSILRYASSLVRMLFPYPNDAVRSLSGMDHIGVFYDEHCLIESSMVKGHPQLGNIVLRCEAKINGLVYISEATSISNEGSPSSSDMSPITMFYDKDCRTWEVLWDPDKAGFGLLPSDYIEVSFLVYSPIKEIELSWKLNLVDIKEP